MAILTIADIPTYAPQLETEIGKPALLGKLDYLQSVIEGLEGCNRPIEINEFTEQINCVNLNPCQDYLSLSYAPVDFSDIAYVPIVEVRYGANEDYVKYALLSSEYNSYYSNQIRPYWFTNCNDWITLGDTDYVLEVSGILRITKLISITDIRVTYRAGLNFSLNNQEIRSFKASAGQLLQYLYKSATYSGVSRVQVPFDEWQVSFNNRGVDAYSIPDNLMSFFKKYRPLGGYV